MGSWKDSITPIGQLYNNNTIPHATHDARVKDGAQPVFSNCGILPPSYGRTATHLNIYHNKKTTQRVGLLTEEYGICTMDWNGPLDRRIDTYSCWI
jgi:hypothetical protein